MQRFLELSFTSILTIIITLVIVAYYPRSEITVSDGEYATVITPNGVILKKGLARQAEFVLDNDNSVSLKTFDMYGDPRFALDSPYDNSEGPALLLVRDRDEVSVFIPVSYAELQQMTAKE